jgi:hypothetical protein
MTDDQTIVRTFGTVVPGQENYGDVLCRDGEIYDPLEWLAAHRPARRRSLAAVRSYLLTEGVMNAETEKKLRAFLLTGMSQAEIAKQLRVTPAYVSAAMLRLVCVHVPSRPNKSTLPSRPAFETPLSKNCAPISCT